MRATVGVGGIRMELTKERFGRKRAPWTEKADCRAERYSFDTVFFTGDML